MIRNQRLLNDCSNTTRTYCTSTFTLFEYHFSIYFLCFLWLKSAYFRWISQSYLYLHDFLAPFWHRILLLTKLKVSSVFLNLSHHFQYKTYYRKQITNVIKTYTYVYILFLICYICNWCNTLLYFLSCFI